MSGMARRAGGFLATLGVAVLTGCAAAPDRGQAEPQQSAPATSGASSRPGPTAALPQPPALTATQGARADLSELKCAADASGRWSGSGTVTSSASGATTYVVSFSVVTKEGGSVRGRGLAVRDLAPGASATVAVREFHTEPGDGLRCLVSVTRGSRARP